MQRHRDGLRKGVQELGRIYPVLAQSSSKRQQDDCLGCIPCRESCQIYNEHSRLKRKDGIMTDYEFDQICEEVNTWEIA